MCIFASFKLQYHGEYASIDPALEYFDVYSPPIKTLYAQVFWTQMDAVPLPAPDPEAVEVRCANRDVDATAQADREQGAREDASKETSTAGCGRRTAAE